MHTSHALERVSNGTCRQQQTESLPNSTLQRVAACLKPCLLNHSCQPASLVRVPLINDNIAKVRQHARELGVDRQDAAVQHVGVGDQQLGPVPDLRAFALHQAGSDPHSTTAPELSDARLRMQAKADRLGLTLIGALALHCLWTCACLVRHPIVVRLVLRWEQPGRF